MLAVGTTTVRVLETIARGGPLEGRPTLFVTPGFEFQRVDALLTNFHLPRIDAARARDGLRRRRAPRASSTRLAIDERYRFYSFGDAMLIL